MSRRYLAFVIGINAIISLTITLLAIWMVELRRPDPEQLASIITPRPQVILAATPAPATTPVPQNQPVAAAPTAAPPAPAQQGELYTVRAGDSLSGIATKINVSINELLEANNLDNPDFVFVGQVLVLPVDAAEISQPVAPSTGDQASNAQSDNSSSPAVEEIAGFKITQADNVGNVEAEVLQIVNDSDIALNLQGWRVRYDGGPTYTFGNFPIFPGGSVRLHTTTGTDTSIDLYWRQSTAVWQSQRIAQLINNQGQLVAEYTIP